MKRTRPAYRYFFFGIILLSALSLLLSCSQGSPEVRSTLIQVLRVQEPNLTFTERLSFFVFFDDPDGSSDFGSIVLSHNKTGLTWTITPENSQVRLRGKDRWTGSNKLAGPAGGAIPGGPYTFTLSDLAGNETAYVFNVNRPDFPERSPVAFSIKNNRWTIERNEGDKSFTRVFLLLFDVDSNLLYSWPVPDSSRMHVDGTVDSLRSIARKTMFVRCYAENESGSAGVLLTPVNLQ